MIRRLFGARNQKFFPNGGIYIKPANDRRFILNPVPYSLFPNSCLSPVTAASYQ